MGQEDATIDELNQQVIDLAIAGSFAEAISIAEECIARSAQLDDDRRLVVSLNNLGGAFAASGRFVDSIGAHHQALEVARERLGNRDPEVAWSLSYLANVYRELGNGPEAARILREVLELRKEIHGEVSSEYANALNNWADLQAGLGRWSEAVEAFSLLEQLDEYIDLGVQDHISHLTNAALLYDRLGQDTTAATCWEEALAEAKKAYGATHPQYATQLFMYASSSAVRATPENRLDLVRQAIDIQTHTLGKAHPRTLDSLNYLSALLVARGEFSAALDVLSQVLSAQIQTRGSEHPFVATHMNNVAMVHIAMGNHAAAEPLLRRALEILRKALGQEHPELVKSLNALAGLYVATGRENEGLVLIQQAAATEDKMIGQVFSIGSESQRMAYLRLIQVNVDMFLSLVVCYLPNRTEAVRAAQDLVLRRKALGAEALAVQRDALLGGRYPALEQSLRDLTTLRMQIAQKTLAGPSAEGIAVHRKRLAEWNDKKERLEAELARQIPEMNVERKLRTADRQAVALALPAGVALVEFVRFEVFDFKTVPARGESAWRPARYVAFIMRAGEPDDTVMIDLGEAEAIDQMIAAFRAAITGEADRRRSRDVHGQLTIPPKTTSGVNLRKIVFDPLIVHFAGCKRLLIAPDGDLNRLPFEVLPRSDGSRLIDDYHISYLGAGRDILRFRVAKSGRSGDPLVVADPDLDLVKKEDLHASPLPQPARTATAAGRQSWDLDPRTLHFEPLPATRVEGERIAEMLGVRPRLGAAALEASLKACNSPRILHLATHGFFLEDQGRDPKRERRQRLSAIGGEPSRILEAGLENPLLRSGLVLAGFNTWCRGGSLPPEAEDGLLTAEDVSGLNLLDTDLVVLSACETGLGEVRTGEGVFGLRRAFMLAGTKGLVMSLWKVPDEETRKLMEDFYQRIQKPGQSRAEALRAAQLTIKEKEEYRDPLYWGAFIYEGDPGVSL